VDPERRAARLDHFPDSGRGELDHVTVRIAEVQTPRATFPTYLLQKIDIMFCQTSAPRIQCVFGNAECDMARTATIVLGKGDGWQEITTRRFVRRVRCLATDDEQIALIGHAKHAARVTGFHFAQTENLLVKIAGARQLLYEKRGFDETIQR